jgi:hypothetical protein
MFMKQRQRGVPHDSDVDANLNGTAQEHPYHMAEVGDRCIGGMLVCNEKCIGEHKCSKHPNIQLDLEKPGS